MRNTRGKTKTEMTKEKCITQTIVAKLGMQVYILPQEEEAVAFMLVVGWLVVTDS